MHSGNKGNDIKWELDSRNGNCMGENYQSNTTTTVTCCGLKTSWNTLKCYDKGGNRWTNGYLLIHGHQYCNNKSWSDPNEVITRVKAAGTNIFS